MASVSPLSVSRLAWTVAACALLAGRVAAASAPSAEPIDFPLAELLPKGETGATAFLAEHPEYDGRGVVVAIFDTGVDPGAPGLQVTSDGKPKIIDLVDGSGSGDVPTTTVAKVENGVLKGLTGRDLTPGPWENPTGEYHLGIKPAWEIYPGGLVTRMKAKRRERWDEEQRGLEVAARDALAAFDAAHAEPTEAELREREELKGRLDVLQRMQKDYDDPGPVFDCVVFHDGTNWRAVIDTDEDGDLGDEKAMTNYRTAREWATFDAESLFNFAVNIYEDGNLLSIVADCGSHGTHVAGIVAANHPDAPELNGLAPGAQIVAVKIGDTRIGSSSMGQGQARGLVAVRENGCDLINMSYGGSGPLPDYGHIIDLYEETVYEQGVIFVASAGNEGPALSTAGSPGGTTSALIGVGAYVSADMMRAMYSMREKLPDTQFTWSSRGPTLDGDLGVDISAPGGAIAPVPNWTLEPNDLKNGTSMSAPSACGGIALLLSGLRQEGRTWTPQSVKRAVKNTAQDVPGIEPFALGQGLLRVDRAWEMLAAGKPYSPDGLRFDVRVPSRGNARGIYLREKEDLRRPTQADVSITPRFARDVDNREKVDLQLEVALASTADWVKTPDVLHLTAGGRSIRLLVDPRGLSPGPHYAEVTGVDLAHPEQGPIFRVPVTAIRSHELPEKDPAWKETLTFRPGQIHRRFFQVPRGATWADLVVRGGDHESARQLVIHAVQLEPRMQWDAHQLESYVWIGPDEEVVRSFAVLGERTLEVDLAHYWSSLGEADFSFELTFHGIVPDDGSLFVDGAFPARRSGFTATLRDESVSPEAELTTRRTILRPADAEIRPLPGDRDLLPQNRREHELILTYEFERKEKGSVRPIPVLDQDGRFWEYWESGLWMLFDEGKRLVDVGGGGPEYVSLEKGKYTLRYHVRHTDASRLEKIKSASIGLDEKLAKPIGLDVLDEAEGSFAPGHEFGTRSLKRGERATFWVASPVFDELPEGMETGDLLLGTISYGEEQDNRTGAGKRPGGFPLAVRVGPAPEKEKEEKAKDEEKDKDGKSRLDDELRDLSVKHLAELHAPERSEDFDRLAKRILERDSDYLPVWVERMRRLAEREGDQRDPAAIVKACDAVISRIDATKVAAAVGVEADAEDEAAKKERTDAEERRDSLVEALRTKAKALEEMPDADGAFEATFRELDRWADTKDDDNVELFVERERRRGRVAVALAALDDRIGEAKPERELYEKRIELLEQLGWPSWAGYEKRWLLRRLPGSYPPF